MNCLHCHKNTKNDKFCSRSCAASLNNKIHPKRKPENVCIVCNIPIVKRRKYCPSCFYEHNHKDMTLEAAIYCNHHRSSAFALVRTRARSIVAKLKIEKCQMCGYPHIETAHIKPISSFPLTTMLSEINCLENLAALCPNCHWEYDHGLLKKPLVGLEPT